MHILWGIIAISLLLAIWLIFCRLRLVQVRHALVIYNRMTGKVHQLIVGPGLAIILPLEDTMWLDLSARTARLNVNDIITSDLAVTASLDIFYAFDPALFRVEKLVWILPALTNIEKIVESWADYILRSLAAGQTTTALLTTPIHRARLEERLRHTLQDRLQSLGVRIHTIRLLCHPAPMMLEAQLSAARAQLAAQARAQALEMLATALGPDRNLSHILPLEVLQQAQRGDTMTALNLSLPVASTDNEQVSPALHWMLASH